MTVSHTFPSDLYFPRLAAETIAYQYDVVMNPDFPALSKKAWRIAEAEFRNNNSRAYIAYDGKKNAFSTAKFDTLTVKVNVNKDEEDYYPEMEQGASYGAGAGRGGRGGARGGRGGRGASRGGGQSRPQSAAPSAAPAAAGNKSESVTITLKQVPTQWQHIERNFYVR